MTKYRAYTDDSIVSPVSTQELADWLRGDANDPIYSGILIAATSTVVNWLQRDLIQRTWNLEYQDWPIGGTMVINSLSQNQACYQNRIDLPYAQLIQVDAVVSYGEVKVEGDDYEIINQLPAQLCFDSISFNGYYYGCEDPALQVQYIAGFGADANSVPAEIRQAILMVAGYMHTSRGCSADDAIKMSGADSVLHPWRVCAGVVV